MNAAFQVLFCLKFFMEDLTACAQSNKCKDLILKNMHLLSQPNSNNQTQKVLLHVRLNKRF